MRRLVPTLVAVGLGAMTATGVAVAQGQGDAHRSASGAAHSNGQQSGGGNSASAPGHTGQAPQGQGQAQSQGNGQAATHSSGQGNAHSSAQSSGHGANVSGPYDPSGVGLPSGNGASTNNNGNRPCAGCVGNADSHNPPGQLPGGSDANRGYECDQNQGVGQTNPAHSGCSSSRTPESPPPGRTETPPGPGPAGNVQPGPTGGGEVAGEAGGPGQPTVGQPSGGPPPLVPGGGGFREARTVVAEVASQLPFTGLGLGSLALIGAALIGVGLGIRRASAEIGDATTVGEAGTGHVAASVAQMSRGRESASSPATAAVAAPGALTSVWIAVGWLALVCGAIIAVASGMRVR